MVRFYTSKTRAAAREWPSAAREGLVWEGGEMPNADEKISRAGFLKLGVLGISALAFAAGCGEEEDDDEGEDDD